MSLGWTPKDGELVKLASRNRWQLPAGRYKLEHGAAQYWHLSGITNDTHTRGICLAHLIGAETAGSLEPLPAAVIEREAQEVRLRLHAPLQGKRTGKTVRQHDASDLALFRSSNEPGLL